MIKAPPIEISECLSLLLALSGLREPQHREVSFRPKADAQQCRSTLEWLLNRKLKGRGGFAMMARVSFVGSPMAEPIAFKYRAFISYGHADTDWAKWLHRGLEGRTDTGNGCNVCRTR